MYIDDKTVFVAGATGMAGSAIVRNLLDASPTVRVRGSFRGEIGHFIDDPRVTYDHADFRNTEDCARLARGCDTAVLAASVTGGAKQAAEEPWRIITDNVVLHARLIEAIGLAGIRRAIYISSATVYQEFDGFVSEEQLNWNVDPLKSYMGTGWVNRYAEKLCQFWHQQNGITLAIARASNIFGPYAKFDPISANFIPSLIRKAVARMEPFEVWGNPDITRDVIYSEDFGAAIVALLNAPHSGFDIFNVGTARLTRVGEVVDWALRFADHSPREIAWRGDAPTSTQFRALDCRKLTEVTGWRPAISIEEGVARTTRWWQQNHATWTR